MRILSIMFIAGLAAFSFSQCKKDDDDHKLENPFGLLLLGSDTSLADGRYVIRTPHGCAGYAHMLTCDNADEVLRMSATLYPTDHLFDMDTLAVWYVKKVRYVSPDPDYALAFGYRIYQYRPNGTGYRFLSFSAKASPDANTNDEVGDGGGPSATVRVWQRENYPRDPNVPTSFATSTSPEEADTRYIFQFYESKDTPGQWQLKAGGRKETSGSQPEDRWKFCTGYWDESTCDATLPPHFRSEYADCEWVDDDTDEDQRCYIDEFVFQKVY